MFQPTWPSLGNTIHIHDIRWVNCKIKSYKKKSTKIHKDSYCSYNFKIVYILGMLQNYIKNMYHHEFLYFVELRYFFL